MARAGNSELILTAKPRGGISIASILGATFSLMLVCGAIALGSHSMRAFLSIEGLMIVVGGTLAVAFMSFQAEYVLAALKAMGLMFKKPVITHGNLHHDMANIMRWARVVKDSGLRGLEADVSDAVAHDPILQYGLDMVVSNYSPQDVRGMLETAAEAYYKRDTLPSRVLLAMAGHAPAFGMVGTLIGMVIMLGSFTGDFSNIASGLSVALLSTLYGLLFARLLCIPASAKLVQKQEEIKFRNHLIAEGLVMLVDNRSSQAIEDRLSSFLKPGIYQAEGRR